MTKIHEIAKLLRIYSLVSTTKAGSGHTSSCLSAADLMASLFAQRHFHYDVAHPNNPNNDQLIFSKGHAAPLFYALWAVAGGFPKDELLTLRAFGSRVEGHPTLRFPHTVVPTGSLGIGLSVGVGLALHAKQDNLSYRTYVLLGDSEMAEGIVWEALQIATHYKLDNIVGIVDANRLGQRGETLHGHDLVHFEEKARAFGWFPLVIDGHNIDEINAAYETAEKIKERPTMIIAKTFKGKGVSQLEDKNGKHGIPLTDDELSYALDELGAVDESLTITLPQPEVYEKSETQLTAIQKPAHVVGSTVATRRAYGDALTYIVQTNNSVVVLDAEVGNSTYADAIKLVAPDKFLEMYIAEQNMVGVGTGLAKAGKIPYVSTFAAFLTRAADQLRMTAYSGVNLKVVGSHAGVSIGQDGTSQMGLEDIALMRALFGSVVLYPADGNATIALVEQMGTHQGLCYLRTTRSATPVIYSPKDEFTIGGSKVHTASKQPHTHVIVAAGITLHEALKAQQALLQAGVVTVVVDVYSIKPLDVDTLYKLTQHSEPLLVVEDHYPEGGIAEAVRSGLADKKTSIHSLAVCKMPQSGTPAELLHYMEIDSEAIVKKIKDLK